VRNAHIEAIISNDRGAGGAGCAANVNGESHDTMHGRIGGFSARTEELGRTGQIGPKGSDTASVGDNSASYVTQLGRGPFTVSNLEVKRSRMSRLVSTHIDKELLVVAVGAKVVAACQKTTEYVRIKVRRSA
jgi:hypothetical protein